MGSPNQSTMESSPIHPWNLSPENLASLPSSDKPRQVVPWWRRPRVLKGGDTIVKFSMVALFCFGFYYLTTKILLPTICNVLGARSTLSRRTSSDSLLTTFCKGLCNLEPI